MNAFHAEREAYDQGLFRFQEPHRKPNPNVLSKAGMKDDCLGEGLFGKVWFG